jgi:hypothetical protein
MIQCLITFHPAAISAELPKNLPAHSTKRPIKALRLVRLDKLLRRAIACPQCPLKAATISCTHFGHRQAPTFRP